MKGYLSYKDNIAGTVWPAARTGYEGKMEASACSFVKGILFGLWHDKCRDYIPEVNSSPVDLFSF